MPKHPILPQAQYNFKTALLDFQKLKQQTTLPYKMQIKLQYLQNKILGRKLVLEQYKQLPQYQLQSLQQCDTPSQMTLFTSIVKCLCGKQVIVYFKNQKAYIKKQQAFSIWKKCYVSCDSIFLYMKKKANKKTNYYEFCVKGLRVSRKYIQYKGRVCFGIMYQGRKYMLGFEQETACQRIFKTLKQLVKDNHPQMEHQNMQQVHSQRMLKQQQSDKFQSVMQQKPLNTLKQSSSSFNHGTNYQHQQSQSSSATHSLQYLHVPQSKLDTSSRSIMQFQSQIKTTKFSEEQLAIKKEEQFHHAIRQQIKKENLSNDNDYKLIKNFQIGRMLLWNGAPLLQNDKSVKTKTSIILSLPKLQPSWLLQQYLQMKSWNLQVQQSKIIHKISSTSYKLFLQFKKYSIMSLARWTIVIATAAKVDSKVYLLIRSLEELIQQELTLGNYMSTVRMKTFNQTIEISQRTENDQKTLMTILTVSDFGGYCSKQDNLGMIVQVISNMQNFYNFLQQQAIAKEYEEKGKNLLFELEEDRDKEAKNRNNDNEKIRNRSRQSSQQSLISYQENNSVRQRSQTTSQFSQEQDDICQEKEQQQEKQFVLTKNKLNQSKSLLKEDTLTSHQQDHLLHKQFLQQFTTYQQTSRGTQTLVQFITSQLHQSHYLKHKFIINEHFNPSATKYPNNIQGDNWLLQKGKWRVNGVELIFTNEQILAQQKNVIKLILKQLSSSVMSGKNIMNMSLPVEIFQEKSFLEKLAEMFGFFPYYFAIAAKEKNIVKQITTVTQAFAFATTICPNIEKPFNPILGETYQCTIGGVTLSFQQISHHPPISAFYIKTQQYQCYGNQHPNVDIGLNTAVAKNINPIFIHFYQTNTRYVGYGQDFEIGGLIFGNRTYKNSGKVNVFQEKNQILCQLSYGKSKKHIYQSQKKLKTGEIIGGVYKVSNAFTKRFKHVQWKNFDGIKYDQKIQQLAKIHGNWMGDFYIDGTKVRGIYDITPYKPVKDVVVLPSDCSYRLDVFYKKIGDMKKSQQWKEVMENSQRKERKLREEQSGRRH